MRILKRIEELAEFLKAPENRIGCLADTGFLYALAYVDDRLYGQAASVFDLLAEREVGIFANVISRLEFVDLVFRKQVTSGALKLLELANPQAPNQDLFRLLKNIRDQNTAEARQGNSFKIGERQLKTLRAKLTEAAGPHAWTSFCETYVGEMLKNEWQILEQDLGLNFIEIMEGATSDLFATPLLWADMVKAMGTLGIRGPDAMIVNLFSKSKLPLLITGDSDFEACFAAAEFDSTSKAIFLLT